MPSAGPERDLAAALHGLWERRREGFAARVEAVETAVAALVAGDLDEPVRAEAEREAHKLAGALGTFGLPAGSELARELEHALAADGVAEESPTRLAELVLALARAVERGPEPLTPAPWSAAAEPGSDTGAAPAADAVLLLSGDSELAARLAAQAAAQGILLHSVQEWDGAHGAGQDGLRAVLVDLGGDDVDAGRVSLLERLRAEQPDLPVFVISDGGAFGQRVKLARLGVSAVLVRGAPPVATVAFIAQSLARRTRERTRIAALDDDPAILAALEALLAPEGIEVVTLEKPEALWERLADATFDLVVLDADIPSVSGIELCRLLRADPRFRELPVLFLSAKTDAATVQRMFTAGADDFVSKPIVPAELLGRIRNRVSRARLLRELADRDALTGVENRRKASADLARLLLMADRYEQPVSVAILDIDHFKAVNDRHGHVAGDAVLRALGELLARSFRGEDVVGRWGGEEFLVGMYGAHRDDGVRRLEALLERFRAIEVPSGTGAPLRAAFSGGIAQYPADASDLQGLYRRADEALYRAKAMGRSRIVSAGADSADSLEELDVLVVEDDDALRDLLVQALGSRGYTSAVIGDGITAAEALEGPQPRLRPRAALLDVDLPGLDGLSVLRRLARAGTLDRVRVIMLTARAGESEVLEALELGAFDHVAKPFSVPVLMQRVERALDGQP